MTEKLRGRIAAYCIDASSGVITTDNTGQNYTFHIQDWESLEPELSNDTPVEFNLSSGRAVRVKAKA